MLLSMLATVACTVISCTGDAAESDVHQVRGNDGDDTGNEEQYLMLLEYLL